MRGAYLRTICHLRAEDEYEINHWRFQMYLGVFGHHCRRLTFQPIDHFYNLFEFLRASYTRLWWKIVQGGPTKRGHGLTTIILSYLKRLKKSFHWKIHW